VSGVHCRIFLSMAIRARNIIRCLVLCTILSHLKFHLIITKKLVGDVTVIFYDALFFSILLFWIIKCSWDCVSHFSRTLWIGYLYFFIWKFVKFSIAVIIFVLVFLHLLELLIYFLLIHTAKSVQGLVRFRVLWLEFSKLRKLRWLRLLLRKLFLFFCLLLRLWTSDYLAGSSHKFIRLSRMWMYTWLVRVLFPARVVLTKDRTAWGKPLIIDANSSLFFD